MTSSSAGNMQTAIAVCGKWIERTSYLDEAFFRALGEVEDAPTVVAVLPDHFRTNNAYHALFTLVLTQELRFRSWEHTVILWQYKNILISSAMHDFVLLHAPTDMEHGAACARWASWEVVANRWPFDMQGETRTVGYFEAVCCGMWTKLREVAATAFEEEARVGLCVFDVMAERGVVGRKQAEDGGAEQPVGRVRAVVRKVRARLSLGYDL